MEVESIDLTDIKIEEAIMAVMHGTSTSTEIFVAYSNAGFTLGGDKRTFTHYLYQLVKKGYLKKQREGWKEYFWKADKPNPFISTQ